MKILYEEVLRAKVSTTIGVEEGGEDVKTGVKILSILPPREVEVETVEEGEIFKTKEGHKKSVLNVEYKVIGLRIVVRQNTLWTYMLPQKEAKGNKQKLILSHKVPLTHNSM